MSSKPYSTLSATVDEGQGARRENDQTTGGRKGEKNGRLLHSFSWAHGASAQPLSQLESD